MIDNILTLSQLLAAAIRARYVSAKELLEKHLAQIYQYNPALNTVITLNGDRACEQARKSSSNCF